MMKPSRLLAIALLALPLAACGEKQKDVAAQAGGEILPGSISDEMLPMDTATSKPPLAPKPAAAKGDGGDEAAAEEPGAGDAADKAPEAAPAADKGE